MVSNVILDTIEQKLNRELSMVWPNTSAKLKYEKSPISHQLSVQMFQESDPEASFYKWTLDITDLCGDEKIINIDFVVQMLLDNSARRVDKVVQSIREKNFSLYKRFLFSSHPSVYWLEPFIDGKAHIYNLFNIERLVNADQDTYVFICTNKLSKETTNLYVKRDSKGIASLLDGTDFEFQKLLNKEPKRICIERNLEFIGIAVSPNQGVIKIPAKEITIQENAVTKSISLIRTQVLQETPTSACVISEIVTFVKGKLKEKTAHNYTMKFDVNGKIEEKKITLNTPHWMQYVNTPADLVKNPFNGPLHRWLKDTPVFDADRNVYVAADETVYILSVSGWVRLADSVEMILTIPYYENTVLHKVCSGIQLMRKLMV